MRALVVVLLLAAGAIGAAAWMLLYADDGAEDAALAAAEDFLAAWERGDWAALDALVADPAAGAGDAHRQQAEALAVDDRDVELTGIDLEALDAGEAAAAHRASHDLGELGAWSYQGTFSVVQVDADEQEWRVEWEPSVLHPDLEEGQEFDRHLEWPPRAQIVGRDGQPLAGEGDVVIVGVEPRRVEDEQEVIDAVDELTPATADEARAVVEDDDLVEDWFYPIVTMPRSAYDEVRDELRPVPGLSFQEDTDRAAASEAVAELVGRVDEITAEQLEDLGAPYEQGDHVGRTGLEAGLERELAGSPSTAIRLVDAEDGSEVSVLEEREGQEPTDVAITVDPATQDAAAQALDDLDDDVGTALVAVDTDDGAVLAAVSRPLGGFDRALTGQYAPGSTFKVVTTTALLEAGLTPGAEVSCPETTTAGGRTFRNADNLAPGEVDFTEAFARSCNTAFIEQAADLPEGALADTAATFGFGDGDDAVYDVGGRLAAASFPPPEDAAEAAAAAIGQGRVAASPVTMAGVAAAAVDGHWNQPHLLLDDDPPDETLPESASALPDLMRAVVTDGTGTDAEAADVEVLGKTGTAEHDGGDDHAWFIGAVGTTAFAILVEEGGSGGDAAAPIAARFAESLP